MVKKMFYSCLIGLYSVTAYGGNSEDETLKNQLTVPLMQKVAVCGKQIGEVSIHA